MNNLRFVEVVRVAAQCHVGERLVIRQTDHPAVVLTVHHASLVDAENPICEAHVHARVEPDRKGWQNCGRGIRS